MLYTTPIYIQTTQYKYTSENRRTLLFGYERFINNFRLWFFDTRRDTILKSFVSYYANNTPTLGTSRGPISMSQHHGRTLTSQQHCRTPISHHHGRTPNPTVCFNGRQPNYLPTWPKVNFQLTLFQNLQILRAIASEHDVIHTPAQFPIWGLLWQLWLSYPLRVSVKLYPMSVHLN